MHRQSRIGRELCGTDFLQSDRRCKGGPGGVLFIDEAHSLAPVQNFVLS